jgi:transcriptional regulator with XRE-family HTH domain
MDTSFGLWLAAARRRRGWSQAVLASHLGVPRAAVSAWETGKRDPSPESEGDIRRLLGRDAPVIGPYGAPVQPTVAKALTLRKAA